jgi:hypothetical protein
MSMIQYAVDVPTPSADRLKPKTLEVHEAGGFAGRDFCTQTADLTIASKTVMFEMPYFVKHEDEMKHVMDGFYFYCLFKFANDEGSRTEEIKATPRKVSA